MHKTGRTLLLLATLILAATLTLPGAVAKTSLTVEVREKGCSEGVWCFEVTEGSLADIAPGEEVTITFKNTADGTPHQLDVTTKDHMDAGHEKTSRDDNIANTTTNMASGEEETITFTVPADAKGIYLYCGITGHEQLGMWLLADFEASDDGDTAESPAPGLTAIALGALAIAMVGRRRLA